MLSVVKEIRKIVVAEQKKRNKKDAETAKRNAEYLVEKTAYEARIREESDVWARGEFPVLIKEAWSRRIFPQDSDRAWYDRENNFSDHIKEKVEALKRAGIPVHNKIEHSNCVDDYMLYFVLFKDLEGL